MIKTKKNNCVPLISVIVPVYNSEKYLEKCLESIVKQTYSNLEVLLINDGSTDHSKKICQDFCDNDKRFVLINQKNKGAAAAKNLGLKKARGEYACFVDSDDYVSCDYVSYLYGMIKKYDADLAIASYIVKSNKKAYTISEKKDIHLLTNEECLKQLLESKHITVSLCAKMYKESIYKSIQFPEGYMYEDDASMYEIVMNAKKIVYGPKDIYYYIIRKNSVMNSSFKDERLILLKYSRNMQKTLLRAYPTLHRYIEKKGLYYDFSILRQLVVSNLNDKQIKIKKELKKKLKQKKYIIILSNIYSLKEKLAILSLLFGEKFYKFAWRIYTYKRY